MDEQVNEIVTSSSSEIARNKEKYSQVAKDAGHRLYQWAYTCVAEGESINSAQLQEMLDAQNLSPDDQLDAFTLAMAECEYYRTDLSEKVSDEDYETQTTLHQNLHFVLFDAGSELLTREFENL
jgi:hypothetical protein